MQQFYGGRPGDWLELPMRELRCYVAMLPRLQAENALLSVAAGRAGDAWTDSREARRIISRWEQVTAPPRTKPKKLTPEEFALQLQALGLVAK